MQMMKIVIVLLMVGCSTSINKSSIKKKLKKQDYVGQELEMLDQKMHKEHLNIENQMNLLEKGVREETVDINEQSGELNAVKADTMQAQWQDNMEALGSHQLYVDQFNKKIEQENYLDHFN